MGRGGLLVVWEEGMIGEGVKRDKRDKIVREKYVKEDVEMGIGCVGMIIDGKKRVKDVKLEW